MPLTSRIPVIIAQLDQKTVDALKDLAEDIADGARERVPVDSGALRDSIHVEDRGHGVVAVVAGDTDVYYGHIVENGSVNAPAQPFLTPAYEAEKGNIAEILLSLVSL